MKINSTLLKTEREKRAWSQEHLAMVAGLGLRTVQRIETSGVASYESIRAIASAYNMTTADFRLDQEAASENFSSPTTATSAATHEVGAGEQTSQQTPDKNSIEWKSRPAWVRAIFAGSSLVRMDRDQLKKLEAIESILATLLVGAGILALFDLIIPSAVASPLLVSGMMLFAAAYITTVNIRIGDKFSVWPWLASTTRSGSRRFAFNLVSTFGVIFLLGMLFPVWS